MLSFETAALRPSRTVRGRCSAASPAAVVVVALLASGCGSDDSSDAERGRSSSAPASAPEPALCAKLRARVVGKVATPSATELSGLVLSRSQREVLWTHNDSGDRARVLAVAPAGRGLAEVTVAGAQNVDWEDIALGPAPHGGDALYLGDIGDNEAQRSTVVVYRVAEPRVAQGTAQTATAQRFTLRYRDGAHDAEALLVDPSDGALVIVTKSFGGTAGIYVAHRPREGAATPMRRVGDITLNAAEPVVAGDVSGDGRTAVLRTYDGAYAWSRRRGEALTDTLRRDACTADADLLVEGQSESIALTADGRAFYTVPEGEQPEIRRWGPPR